jgi:hypothetical protein
MIIRGWYNRPFSGLSNSGLGSTPAQKGNKILFLLERLTIQLQNPLFWSTLILFRASLT